MAEIANDVYLMRSQVLRVLGVSHGELNRVLATGKVRVRRLPNAHPRINLDDVKMVLDESVVLG